MAGRQTWFTIGLSCLVGAVTLNADTLVLRDGRRIPGQLIGIRGDDIEFDGELGRYFGAREQLRINRREVVRIEFDDYTDRREREREVGREDRRDDRRDEPPRGRPSGLRERSVSVDSWVAWNDAGVDVREGSTVYFSATGRVRWGPNRQDGPEGERNSPRNDGRPIPTRPAAALIGRIGNSNDYFFIGADDGPIRMRSSGRLYLGVNDDFLKDNTGSFRVTVYY